MIDDIIVFELEKQQGLLRSTLLWMAAYILWPEQYLPVGTRGSGLSSKSRSTFTDLLTLAGEKSTGQSAALYLRVLVITTTMPGLPI